MNVGMDEMELICDLVRQAVRELQSDVDQVKEAISNEIEIRINNSRNDGDETEGKDYAETLFSAIDDAYIDQKYIQYCSEFWLKEVERFLNDDKNLSFGSVQDLLQSLDNIKDLHQIPDPLNQLPHYTLLKINHALIRRNMEKTFIKKFKSICSEKIIDYLGCVRIEIDFLKALVDFLLASKNIRVIIAQLKLASFCDGLLRLDQLLNEIMNLRVEEHEMEVIPLQEAADSLKKERQLSLLKMFSDVIKVYIKPVEINVTTLDGRSVIEAKGKSIIMSSILKDVEDKISRDLDIKELRIVGADALHIDENLKNETWHGKNIVIVAKKIKIHRKLAWNLSGKDSDHTYLADAGTGLDGHGNQGADGYTGESGGNVLIVVDEIKNGKNLTIISNGGKGSKGQDGGNGSNGTDGKGLNKDKFIEMFPSVVSFLPNRLRRDFLLGTTVQNIRSISTLKTNWHVDGDQFIESTTKEGNEITFSYSGPAFFNCVQAFLLFKGSEGNRGNRGGGYGLGGEGGYNGEISIDNSDIVVESERGQPGENGKGGLFGSHGKNGWDMGYTDYQSWSTAVFYGQDQRSRLQVTYHNTSWGSAPKDSVWCPHHIAYAQIGSARIEHKKEKKYQEQTDTRQNNALQHQAQATKKKSILRGKILADYSHCYSSLEQSTIQNSEFGLENIMQRALQAMIENSEQQENVTAELEIKHVKSNRPDKNIRRYRSTAATSSLTSEDTLKMDIESLIHLLTSDAELDDKYNGMNTVEHNHSQLDKILSHIEMRDKSSAQKTEMKKLKLLLIEKYRFATLERIANQFPDHLNVTCPIDVAPESASRYLLLAKENDDRISHDILGTLNQYLYKNDTEQRENIRKFIVEEMLIEATHKEALKHSVETFFLKAVRSSKVHPIVEKYYIEYLEFPEKKQRSLDILLEALIAGLERHEDIFALWIKRDKSHSTKVQLTIKLQKEEHKLLNAMYYRYNNKLEETYDWNKCCEDKVFLKEYIDHIFASGRFSESYRELLAHVFDVNIRLYFEQPENQFHLLSNHKPSSKQRVHVLRAEDTLKQLDLDENYLRLEEDRAKKGLRYAKVFVDTTAFGNKQEFDNYFEKEILSPQFVAGDTIRNTPENSEVDDESVYKLCKEELENEEYENLKRSVEAFILEIGDSEEVHQDVKKYYNEFIDFSEKREQSLNIYFQPFYSELKRYKHIFALWVAKNNHSSVESKLVEEIRKHHFLNKLYIRFNNQLEQEYDWNKCCKNQNVLDEYYEYIEEYGSLPESFTDLSPPGMGLSNRLEDEYECNPYTHNFMDNDSIELEKESNKFRKTQYRYLDSNLSEDEYLVREEQYIIEIVTYLSCPEERLQMIERLRKITSQYTGHRGILHYLSSRFFNDGMHVSFQELCYLVNSILTSLIQDRKEMNVFCWIVAACSQKNWMAELFILHLENHFKKPLEDKYRWKMYLSKIVKTDMLLLLALKLDQHKSNTPISIQSVEETLKLLSYLPNEEINLEGLDLREWSYALKEKYWAIELSELTTRSESENLSEASYYLLSMENTFGVPLVKTFMTILREKVMNGSIVRAAELTKILSNFYNERWNLSKEELKILSECGIIEWTKQMEKKFTGNQNERDITLLVELIRGNSNTSESISSKLPKIQEYIQSIAEQKPAKNEQLPSPNNRFVNSLIRTKNKVARWFRNDSENSEEASNNSPPVTNPVPGQEILAIEQTDENDFDLKFAIDDESLESTFARILNYTEKSACKMKMSDFKVYCHMFAICLKSFAADKSSEKMEFIIEARVGMLAVISRAIELTRKFKLRDTQKLTILTLLMNDRKTLAQVSTGEGKSLIVVAASIMKALCDEKVDVITSSSVLAKRDAEINRDIYDLFGISVSHNCNEDIEERRAAYSSSQVVYGDLSNFQRDYLLDRFYVKNILGDRDFENVFVDEVDSMLLDKGNNMLYLSHDLEGFDKLESVYVYIWQLISRPAEEIKAAVLHDLYGLITRNDIQSLDNQLDERRTAIIFEWLIQAEILDDHGKMLKENIDDEELGNILTPELNEYKNRLFYLLRECTRRERFIHVPNYLKPFIEEHLDAWINSAITAAGMQEDHNYVIDVDRTKTSRDLNPHITIVDRDTGTDQANSQWDEALHQFLQLKHSCKLSLQSLKAVFISNVSYLQLYKNLYGVTGTLGSLRERTLLMEIHNVDFITIPTSKPKRFHEKIPIFCTDKRKWIEAIFNEAKEFTSTSRKRSVLIICETIDDAETLYKAFFQKGVRKVLHKYTRDYKEFGIAQGRNKLKAGQIIIATNLSGRGTDIKIEDELRNAGGLHVCLTYLPKNSRIEQQAFGRGARSGDEGSGRLIIMGAKDEEYNDLEISDPEEQQRDSEKFARASDMKKNNNNLKILNLKKQRDAAELHRISEIKEYYETRIITEEKYFKKFGELYEALNTNLTKKRISVEVKKILMQSCLDKWAFWLDRNSKWLENRTDDEVRQNFDESLEKFISELNDLTNKDDKVWVNDQPVQMIKLGKHFCQEGKYEDAIHLFDKVVELEPSFSEAAHYYKAFALLKQINWRNKKSEDEETLQELKTELWEAARLFGERSKDSICAETIVKATKQRNENSVIQIDTYAEQQKSLRKLYYLFSESITAIFDRPVNPKSFVNDNITEELSEIVYEDFLENYILTKLQIKKNISDKVLETISFSYGISIEELKDCFSAFENEEIDEEYFRKTFKKDIKLPSRKDFWKQLTKESISSREVRIIIVDVKKLKKVDPSLLRLIRKKINENELEQESLVCNEANEIILNEPAPSMSETDNIILEKGAFRELITTKQKYEFLKKIGAFVSNRKALIDVSKIASASFSRYDSITLKDFRKENIDPTDANKILAELVELKVLKKANSVFGTYRLTIPFDEIHLINSSGCQVYRNAVIGLLSLCFVYRKAIEKIEAQIKQKEKVNTSIYPQLPVNPHDNLIYELMAQTIIRPVRFSTKIKDVDQYVKSIYSRTITKDEFKKMISRSKLIPEERNTDDLFNHLEEKGWLRIIDHEDSVNSNMDPDCYILFGEVNSFDSQYSMIDDSKERSEHSCYEDIKETLEQIFTNRLELANENTIQQIIDFLYQSRSPIKVLRSPCSSLKPLTKCNGLDGSRHIEEINIFTLNGLDQILIIESRNWSFQAFVNTAIVMVIGLIQIIIGIVIEALTSVVGVAASFISEGISDIIFATNMLRSRHFSWQDYLQYKARSIVSTIITGGMLTATFSYFKNALRFGSQVAESSLNVGTRVVETTGSQRIVQSASASGVALAAGRVIPNIINSEAFGFANGEVDFLVKNYIQSLCHGIGSAVLSGIKATIGERDIPKFLDNAYQVLGDREAMKLVTNLSKSFFNSDSLAEKYVPMASHTARSTIQGLQHAIDQIRSSRRSRSDSTSPIEIIRAILALVPKVEELVDVRDIRRSTGSLLNNLERRLMHVSQTGESSTSNRSRQVRGRTQVVGCEQFKKKSIDEWTSLLDKRVGKIIEDFITSPILNEGIGCLTEYCESMIRNRCRFNNVGINNDRYDELRRQYQERELSADAPLPAGNSIEIGGYALKQYHNSLNKLMTKIGNYKLLAALARENVPMDVTCLGACAKVIIKVSGIKGLTIVVDRNGGIKERLSFSVEGADVKENHVIQLALINNRFQLHGSDASEPNRQHSSEMKYNCLYEAVKDCVKLNMTPQEFRAEVANRIQHDTDMQNYIKQGSSSSSSSTTPCTPIKVESVEKPSFPSAIDHEMAQISQSGGPNLKSRIQSQKRQPRNNRTWSVDRAFSTQRPQPVERSSPYI